MSDGQITEPIIGNSYIVKCKSKGHDFIPCFPALDADYKIMQLLDGDEVLYCGKKELDNNCLYAFYVLKSTSKKSEKLSIPIYIGTSMFEFIYPTPRKHTGRPRRIRRRRTRFA